MSRSQYETQTTLKGSDIHAAASSASAEMLLRQELEEKLRSQTKELASEQGGPALCERCEEGTATT